MSSLWYDFLEESGGEVIPSSAFFHVKKSFKNVNNEEYICDKNIIMENYVLAIKVNDNKWWPFIVKEILSEGWLNIKYYQGEKENKDDQWISLDGESIIKSINWCYKNDKEFYLFDDTLLNCVNIYTKESFQIAKPIYLWETVKVGSYMECWVKETSGSVWPVKVLNNIGGRLKLTWFGTTCSTSFYLYFLDYRLRPLGWAKQNNWYYNPPSKAGIGISISNPDTFVRGSPSAIRKDLLQSEMIPEKHNLEEGWLLEAVDPNEPYKIRPARVENVFNEYYYLIKFLEENKETLIGFRGLGTIIPANLVGVNGVKLSSKNSWDILLGEEGYAPHTEYFQPVETILTENDSEFLPGCKLEAVHPKKPDQIMPATVTKCLDGSRLVWIHLDSDPNYPDFLVDPKTSCDIFPVGWSEMVNHSLIMPPLYVSNGLYSNMPLFDCSEISIYFQPQCCLGPFLSRSSAIEMLPKQIGPGHMFPVLKELFCLLLRVSHKPFKLMRLLQLDSPNDKHDLMATIAIPMPKSDCANNNNNTNFNLDNPLSANSSNSKTRVPIYSSLLQRFHQSTNHSKSGSNNTNHRISEWLVEVPVRHRALPEFCRQTSLCLGSCPSFISCSVNNININMNITDEDFNNEDSINTTCLSSSSMKSNCVLHCHTRLSASLHQKIGTTGAQTRRKRLLQRPLMALGFSYRELKSRMEQSKEQKEDSTNGDGTTGDVIDAGGGVIESDDDSSGVQVTQNIGVRTRGSSTLTSRNNVYASFVARKRKAGGGRKRNDNNQNNNSSNNNNTDSGPLCKLEKKDSIRTLHDTLTSNSIHKDNNDDDNGSVSTIANDDTNLPTTTDDDENTTTQILNHDSPHHTYYSAPPTLIQSDHLNPSDHLDQMTQEYSIDPRFLAGDIEKIKLESNPVQWNVEQVAQYFSETNDCFQLADWLAAEGVDGRALLLLNLPSLSDALQLDPAIRLCRHVASLKRAFVEQFADQDQLLPW